MSSSDKQKNISSSAVSNRFHNLEILVETSNFCLEKKGSLEPLSKQTPTLQQVCEATPHTLSTLGHMIGDIVSSYISNPLVVTLSTIENGEVKIPEIGSETGDVFVDWGDNTYSVVESKMELTHTYKRAGTYTVHIDGDITHLSFQETEELLEISQWGNLRLVKGEAVFFECENLVVTAKDSPNLKYTTSLSEMFEGCISLTGDFSRWDVSNILDMSFMFGGCSEFDSDLSKWDVSNAENMHGMFRDCESFKSDLSEWDTSKVKDMCCMFRLCRIFNSDMSKWDVSKVENMDEMFAWCNAFNSDLSKWNVSVVKKMHSMFQECTSFNSDLSDWDVNMVEDMAAMFAFCGMFDCDLTNWQILAHAETGDMVFNCPAQVPDIVDR